MSLAGRFQYKYKKNSHTHMSVKCSVKGCSWKITIHVVEGNEILRVHTYQVNHNHMAQDECSSKVRVSSKRGDVFVEDVFKQLQNISPVKYARILNVIMEFNRHITKSDILKLRQKSAYMELHMSPTRFCLGYALG